MAFSQEVIDKAWKNCGGKCECVRTTHAHVGKHDKVLTKSERGREATGVGKWEAHHKVSVASGGEDIASNCEILCWDCHSKTF